AMDAGNMLKPMLARGELHCIGATTLEEYRQYIEKDAALERRFQTVMVDQPTVEDTISILRGLKERYEVHHGVRIQDNALVGAAVLSNRYITDRFLPDKAIDLVDEACAMVRTEIDSMPSELDAASRKVMQLEIEEAALAKENHKSSKDRLEVLRKELQESRSQAEVLRAQYEAEKEEIHNVQGLKEKLENLRREAEKAERQYDLNKAATIRHGEIPQIEKELQQAQEVIAKKESHSLLREEVTEEEISQIVSRWTGVPVTRLMEGEREKLLRMDNLLHRRVIGQDEAVQAVADAVLRARAGIKDPRRPIGSFIFLGPTGVGKTQLAKVLTTYLFDSLDSLIRIDMSEYMEKFSVSRIVGAPPGYVGYEEGGQLTEKVRRKPYSVVLLDEIEKAHPDVFHLLLQLLDEGRLTDSLGRNVDFRNTIIIMTSNIGSRQLKDFGGGVGFNTRKTPEDENEQAKYIIQKALKKAFAPEFLNRIDDVIMFNQLHKKHIHKIIDIEIKDLYKRVESLNYKLKISPAAKDFIAEKGFDPQFGARPLKRAIQKYLEDEMAEIIIKASITEGDTISVGLDKKNQKLKMRILTGKKELTK
ncbi:MAG: type VI secretion system ATPase TssH, partial [Draconibacterium sp.]